MPVLASWYKKHNKDGLVVIGLTEMNPPLAQIKKALKERGVTYPVAVDKGEKVIRTYGFLAHPDSVIIDRKGKIVHVEVGYVKGDEKALERAFKPLLKAPGKKGARP